MRRKEYIASEFRRSLLHLKSIGIFLLIPVILADVLLPVLLYLVYTKDGGYWFYIYANEYSLPILPLAVMLPCLLSMKDYVGEVGVEILYINRNRVKVVDFLLLYLYALADLFIIAVFVCRLDVLIIPCFAAIAMTTVFLFGLAYFLLYYTKSLTAVIMTEVLYIILSLILSSQGQEFFPFYAKSVVYSNDLLTLYLPIAVIGIILCLLGIRKNKRSCI